ncbi:uncharacterized protein BJ171DRAFT_475569 [Polychytrium aggregatum]|uniref:uncharacterized protein n=1 Tax=Polychytrium aggregatum TaxID=110093 RepID=UPI0022FF2734|nr:uncharacterized protein BJ171DRAFT_475569 [Polychytrium aggregatum]KAI9203878.1 hypothetical protein BJ171DRAFT_475569 [Polychytrium aggregatum]
MLSWVSSVFGSQPAASAPASAPKTPDTPKVPDIADASSQGQVLRSASMDESPTLQNQVPPKLKVSNDEWIFLAKSDDEISMKSLPDQFDSDSETELASGPVIETTPPGPAKTQSGDEKQFQVKKTRRGRKRRGPVSPTDANGPAPESAEAGASLPATPARHAVRGSSGSASASGSPVGPAHLVPSVGSGESGPESEPDQDQQELDLLDLVDMARSRGTQKQRRMDARAAWLAQQKRVVRPS